MKVAFVHDWLVTPAGAERVLEALYEVYPGPVHTLVCDRDRWKDRLGGPSNIRTSFLQRFPKVRSMYRNYLALFPLAVESFDLSEFDVVISSSHAAAKGCMTRADQLHICYCHTPMRYAWDLTYDYLGSLGRWKRMLAQLALHYIRIWDQSNAKRVDFYVANSSYTARRIQKCYGRAAKVIYPPVDVERFSLSQTRKDHFVTVSRLVPYKRVDLLIQAFNELRLPLKIVGDGPLFSKLKALAGPTVELLGSLEQEAVREVVGQAKAFVFAAEEDFGIAPVEAQAAGTPVIAYGRGGVCESVIEGETGLFFREQTVEGVKSAVTSFLRAGDRFDPKAIRKNAERFSRARFQREFKAFVDEKWKAFEQLRSSGQLPERTELLRG